MRMRSLVPRPLRRGAAAPALAPVGRQGAPAKGGGREGGGRRGSAAHPFPARKSAIFWHSQGRWHSNLGPIRRSPPTWWVVTITRWV